MKTTDWEYDFASLPRWDNRERIPYVYDEYYALPQSDTLCCLYSICEASMLNYLGFLAILKNKENPELGSRDVPFSRVIYIEKDDFMEVPAKGYKRLALNSEVRLKGAYFIKCNEVIKDEATGEVIELLCTYDPITKSGTGFTGRKVKGTIHWVSADSCISVDINLFDTLFENEMIVLDSEKTWDEKINPMSKVLLKNCKIESWINNANMEDRYQFFRHGYFCLDKYSTGKKLIFNRIVSLKDSWKGKTKLKG